MDKYSYIANADVTVIDEMYKAYKNDPASVDITWQKFFEGFDFSQARYGDAAPASGGSFNEKEIKVRNLIYGYRSRGHLLSDTNPVRKRKDRKPMISLADFGLSDADLNTTFQVGAELGLKNATLKQILEALNKIYIGSIGFEYMYIRDPQVSDWFRNKIESEYVSFNPTIDQKKRVLSKLNEAVVFENFLHTKFIGQKRFSLEGGESTIPALDTLINVGADNGAEEFVIGMAHRGRLNVLANTMGKTYEQIFTEFEGTYQVDLTMGDGDVKYHMGYGSEINTVNGKKVMLKLMPNPSHLEAVNPVVEGFARAKADAQYGSDYRKIVPILIHGDAAVAGQGIVYEVTQMANLEGYTTGGTIHFVINNQVGFTTDFDDARSSIYCTDVAKIIDAPVLHVNGDDPEAVMFACKIAAEYRQKFNNDIFVDMVCYRRHGHNESDEPKFTQPALYNIIAKHPNPRDIYSKKLIERGDLDAQLAQNMDKEFRQMLQDRLDQVKQKPLPYTFSKLEQEWKSLRQAQPNDFDKSPDTGVSKATIEKIGKALTTLPPDFKPLKQIENLIKERNKMFFEEKTLNWAAGELAAYGSLLLEGKIVRLSGQDVKRGTFSHRHAVVRDAFSNEPYCNLNNIDKKQGWLHIYNSLLSEYGVLGFEYGYNMANPHALTIWEAQFGDFANGAQTMIDQFISCGETKWNRMNGLVMLLPHGYEGQGPEHSNARPERFLSLSADYNMIVANITTPANFFHALRRQLTWDFRKPLIIMSPKSQLRHPMCVSPIEDFTKGGFKEIIDDETAKAKDIKRLLICSGKIYYDLLKSQTENKVKDVAIVRMEQLAPLPEKQLDAIVSKYSNAKVYWVQEEPENMGYWTYILRSYRDAAKNWEVISRKADDTPATGYGKIHTKEQEEVVERAVLGKSKNDSKSEAKKLEKVK